MKTESERFLISTELDIEQVQEGIQRQMLGFNNEIMMVKVWFEESAIGYVHDHRHSQVTYVESGEFEVNIDGKREILCAGDSFYIPPHISHGAVCKKAGVLIDVFSPVREDFLDGEQK